MKKATIIVTLLLAVVLVGYGSIFGFMKYQDRELGKLMDKRAVVESKLPALEMRIAADEAVIANLDKVISETEEFFVQKLPGTHDQERLSLVAERAQQLAVYEQIRQTLVNDQAKARNLKESLPIVEFDLEEKFALVEKLAEVF